MIKSALRLFAITFIVYSFVYPFINQHTTPTPPPETSPIIEDVVVPVVVEQPKHDVALPDFASIVDIKAKKSEFFDFIRPHVVDQNKRIEQQRAVLQIAVMMLQFDEDLSEQQHRKISKIFKEYKIKDTVTLDSLNRALVRVDIVPEELVLMQAANESAWGTSRFARIGLNFFGQWCYKQGCGLVPRGRNEGASHEVAVYQSVQQAVAAYFRNLNTNRAYATLRQLRAEARENNLQPSAVALANGLHAYSERGQHYVEEISAMIESNQEYFSE